MKSVLEVVTNSRDCSNITWMLLLNVRVLMRAICPLQPNPFFYPHLTLA